jgi:hypothetical protein
MSDTKFQGSGDWRGIHQAEITARADEWRRAAIHESGHVLAYLHFHLPFHHVWIYALADGCLPMMSNHAPVTTPASNALFAVWSDPFAGHSALVTWSNNERVRLLLSILNNRDTPITMAVEDVAALGAP